MNNKISRVTRPWTAVALVAIVGVLASVPSPARAGTDYDLRLGVYTDASAFALGAGLISGVGSSTSWYFNPNLEMAFGNDAKVVTLNGDLHYDFASSGPMSFYAVAGPAIVYVNPEFSDSETNLGLNLFGGVTGVRGASRPFVQIKGILSDDTELALMGGIRF
jgi:hypothetical protein